jgi:tetratricopeptide (TPR) repeat protein
MSRKYHPADASVAVRDGADNGGGDLEAPQLDLLPPLPVTSHDHVRSTQPRPGTPGPVVPLTTKREIEFLRLRSRRSRGAHRLLVHGPAGSGRRTLVEAVVAAEAPHHRHVVRASGPTIGDFELAIRRQLTEQSVMLQPDTAATVRQLLEGHRELLLAVFDPPSLALLESFLPSDINGLVIVSAVDARWPSDAAVELGAFEPDEVFAVFRQVSPHTMHRSGVGDRHLIARVVLLAAELGKPGDGFPIDDLLGKGRSVPDAEQLPAAVGHVIDRLNGGQRDLLGLMAILGPGWVPYDLLEAGLARSGRDEHRQGGVGEVARGLAALGLITAGDVSAYIDPAIWYALDAQPPGRAPKRSNQRLDAAAAAVLDESELPDERLLPVLHYVHCGLTTAGTPAGPDLPRRTAEVLANRGALLAAEWYFDMLVDSSAAQYGRVHVETADALNDRGLVRAERGDLQAALRDFEEALAILGTSKQTAPLRRALLWANAGRADLGLRRYARAIEAFERASALLRSSPDGTAFHEVMVLAMLASAAHSLNDDRRARSSLRDARHRAAAITEAAEAAEVGRELRRLEGLIGSEGGSAV